MSFLFLDGWDLRSIRSSKMNFPSTVDRMVQKLETISQQSLAPGDLAASHAVAVRFSLFAEKMCLCKKLYANKLKAEADHPTPGLDTSALPDSISMEELFEGFEDSIWPDLTADWNANMQF
ncbi:uncharacterized protein Z519_12505 [Cladophialophora bantiana CBS 173.52]|uniref:Uncharacterized protein n=1 Tax=Cladophialophora bantiana (strain ATCC 10958 / CBS 173.52 / CDC B-1940 / NIH 8579) TaxID=1442370 RepID=A0A0D2HR50_CLAB1|nr:uncharacterized protein Z519_12505 [Cladophialophora bantiana CBS 173.52]KIW86884.1 hypothetical protein Z519_12505 [Cladophialophora bantiana CBS 173.52]